MQRMGTVVGLKSEYIAKYKQLHTNVWPEVLSMISQCNIRNYSIFLKEPENLLFGYWEYHGSDFAADMAKMAADPKTKAWWELTDPCQKALAGNKPDELWSAMENVFHHD